MEEKVTARRRDVTTGQSALLELSLAEVFTYACSWCNVIRLCSVFINTAESIHCMLADGMSHVSSRTADRDKLTVHSGSASDIGAASLLPLS